MKTFPTSSSNRFHHARLRPHHWLTTLWVLTMVAVPILRWTWGDQILPQIVIASVTLQAAAVLAALWDGWGRGATLLLAAVILPITWAVEWLGSSTGFPFGSYTYTANLQPQLAHVPLIIPLAWLMMLPPAWAVADLLSQRRGGWRFYLVAGLAFTAWDLFLDPQMVAWGFWAWQTPGGYFGIPWVNFAGWFGSATLLTWLVARLSARGDGAHRLPQTLPTTPLVVIYAVTWFLQTVGQLFFWGMVGPALTGGVIMGACLFGALSRLPGSREDGEDAA